MASKIGNGRFLSEAAEPHRDEASTAAWKQMETFFQFERNWQFEIKAINSGFIFAWVIFLNFDSQEWKSTMKNK